MRVTRLEAIPEKPHALDTWFPAESLGVYLARLWLHARSPLATGLKCCAVLSMVLLAAFGFRELQQYVLTAPVFSIHEITVSGNEKLDDSEVIETSGLQIGSNIFELAPLEVETALRGHPWVADVWVKRRLPDSYQIGLRERQAVAVLSMGGLYLVSEEGAIFKSIDENEVPDLPVITGIDRGQFLRDRAYRASFIVQAVAILHDYRGAGLWRREPIAEVHGTQDQSLTLYIGGLPTEVRLGTGPYRKKLRQLRRILDRLQALEVEPAYVYLDNVLRPDRATVKLHGIPLEGEAPGPLPLEARQGLPEPQPDSTDGAAS
ncbi:MAG: FtsQ-type POTRA domain-containing protein [Myxococcota bacterium]